MALGFSLEFSPGRFRHFSIPSLQSYDIIIMVLVLLGIPSYLYEPVIHVLRSFLTA
jgi:hypothetical protein